MWRNSEESPRREERAAVQSYKDTPLTVRPTCTDS